MELTGSKSVELARGYPVETYRALEHAKNRDGIAEFVSRRFGERYLIPLDVPQSKKSGFIMIAVGCLMVEALESFRRGWKDTRNRSELAFCSFFSRWEEFAPLRPLAHDFYRHVRCGVLHQAETTGGWRIWRQGPLVDGTAKTVNAAVFVDRLCAVLDHYCTQLRTEPWDSDSWLCLRHKMAAVCQNAA